MFINNFKYSFKVLIRNKGLIFWTFAFPILLGLFFYLAFSDIENKENFKESQITITNTFETNISLPSITDYINTLYCKEENTCNTSWMTKPGTLLLTLNDINNNLYTMSITEDGSIKIPKALQPYMGGKEIIK